MRLIWSNLKPASNYNICTNATSAAFVNKVHATYIMSSSLQFDVACLQNTTYITYILQIINIHYSLLYIHLIIKLNCIIQVVNNICILYIKYELQWLKLTCAKVATSSPNVSAICTMDGIWLSQAMVEPHPMSTSINVPRNSAISIRHICLLSVMSDRPRKLFVPVQQIIYTCR